MLKLILKLVFLTLLADSTICKPTDGGASTSACPSFTSDRKLCTSDPVYPYYSIKTTYTEAYKHLKSQGLPTEQLPEGYKPVLFYYFGRHGIRYPDSKDIGALNALSRNITEFVENSNDKSMLLCDEIIERVKSFRSHWIKDHDSHVTESGSKELEEIGERFKKLLPSILDPSKDTFSIDVGVSDTGRTTETASAFMKGLYEDSYNETIHLHATQKNATMYHRACKDARNGVKPHENEIVKNFRKDAVLSEMMASFLNRLGLPPNHMEFKDFKRMHELCAYHHAINGSSIWCSLFTVDDLKLLEYYDDIQGYYSVHKDEAMIKAPCAVMSELIGNIDQVVKSENDTKAILRFSHSSALRPFLAYLGLFNNFGSEQEKDHSNYCVNGMLEREWRLSLISPLAANIAFILLKRDFESEYKILTLVQEVPVKIEGCGKVLCSLDDFKESFSESVKNCDIQSICGKGGD